MGNGSDEQVIGFDQGGELFFSSALLCNVDRRDYHRGSATVGRDYPRHRVVTLLSGKGDTGGLEPEGVATLGNRHDLFQQPRKCRRDDGLVVQRAQQLGAVRSI